ncbi:hypothetical protein ACQ4PT_013713 [Festuca glaucescens]
MFVPWFTAPGEDGWPALPGGIGGGKGRRTHRGQGGRKVAVVVLGRVAATAGKKETPEEMAQTGALGCRRARNQLAGRANIFGSIFGVCFTARAPAEASERGDDGYSGRAQGQQEDAHEFLRCLLDNLHHCTLDPKSKGKPSSFDEESIVKHVFGGRLKSQLTCRDCGHCSETFEPFLDLSLEIDQVDDLIVALESFTKVEQIGDVENKLTCERCNVEVCKDKRLMLDKAPDVLTLQLKRFTTLDSSVEKIDKHVAYPSELDLKPFHSNPETEDASSSQDRLSELPDDILLNILERVGTLDALRTCIISERLLQPPAMFSWFDINIGSLLHLLASHGFTARDIARYNNAATSTVLRRSRK